MKRLGTLIGLVVVFVLGICIVPTYATPILDFGVIAPTSGSINFAGGVTSLIGTSIDVDNVVGLGTMLNNNVQATLVGAILNFTTGAHTSGWNFGGGALSNISIVGGVDFDGGGIGAGDIALGTTLLSGVFGNAAVFYLGNSFHITGGNFADHKDEDLLDFYGLPKYLPNGDPLPYNGNFNISFSAPFTAVGDPIVSTHVFSGDITNEPVPEPGTLLLLGSGLVGLGGYAKLRLRRKKKH